MMVSMPTRLLSCVIFFYNDTATTEIYTLSLHDALPICRIEIDPSSRLGSLVVSRGTGRRLWASDRSEEHTSELQSHSDLVCRLLLEKKKRRPQLQLQQSWRLDGDRLCRLCMPLV